MARLLTAFLITTSITCFGTRVVEAIDLDRYISNSENQFRAVALIEGIRNDQPDRRLTASGVLADLDSASRFVFLLTNRHVWRATADSFRITFRSFQHFSDSSVSYSEPICMISRSRTAFVPSSDDSDFALIPIERKSMRDSIYPIKRSEMLGFDKIKCGTDVLYYGYPMRDKGIFSGVFTPPLCRSGTISAVLRENLSYRGIRKLMAGTILIDGVSLGGNSGGPVFTVSQKIGEDGEDIIFYTERKLLGIIGGHFQDSTLPVVSTNSDSTIFLGESKDLRDSGKRAQKYLGGLVAVPDQTYNMAFVIPIEVILEYYQEIKSKGLLK